MGDTTKEMAAFLRTRRERLAPGDVGLTDRARMRRTPGLRREEVAELAGVSVDYVVRLEQGRGLRPSADVLAALAGALRLSDDERAYLFDLARQRQAARQHKADVAPQLVQLLSDLSPLPAMVVNHRNDILAWNTEMTRLQLDFGEVPEQHRNGLWLCLLHPRMSTFYPDREQIIREGIADLRAAWATHPQDESFARFVDDLTAGSAEFARLWALQDVQVRGRGRKRMLHPEVGPVTVHFEVLTPMQDPDQRLVVYRAADPESQVALTTLTRRSPGGGQRRRDGERGPG